MGTVLENTTLRFAEEKAEQLLEQARPKGTWRRNAWSIIERRLKVELQFVEEFDALALCTFVEYMNVARMYFTSVADRDNAIVWLIETGDMAHKLCSVSSPERLGEMSESDQEAVQLSLERGKTYFEEVADHYTGTI